MNVTIELAYGPHHDRMVTREQVQRTVDAMERAIAKASGADVILLTDAKSVLVAIQRQLPSSRPHHAVINLPRTAIPNFTRAGNDVCKECGLDYRRHQAYRYTDDPSNDSGLLLFRLCDGREVKL